MSGFKRGAERYLTKDDSSDPRMNQGGPDNSEDPVQRATAAQLANRKIKAAKGRRPGGAPARPTTSFGPSSSTPQQPGLFTNGAQSFPPTNGAPPIGNGSPNVSFGGFGSGSVGGGSGFDFSSSAAVNNPFANASATPATNGASNGGFGFSFGASQPAATPVSSTGIFSFGGNQQSAASPFSSATSQAPSTGLFGSSTTPSSNVFGKPASSATPGAGLFGNTNGGSTFGATNGGGIFGAASSTSQQPSGGSLFGQPPAQEKPAAPFTSFFGTPAQAAKAPFGQTVDDAMSTSPDNSPVRGGTKPEPNHWNKPLGTIANGVPSSSSSNGGDSPDQPHIEEEKTEPNPFALIPRAPSSEPPKAVEKPAKSIFSSEKPEEKPQEEESPHIEEETKPNPFASIARKTQSTPKPAGSQAKSNFSQSTPASSSIFNLGKLATESASALTSSTNSSTPPVAKASIFSPIVNQPSIVGQSPIVGNETSSKAKVDSTFKPTTQTSSIFKPQASSQPTPTASPATNMFGQFAKSAQAASSDEVVDSATVARLREVGTILPQDRIRDLSKHLTPAIRASILSDDTLEFPSADSGMGEEEIKYWARERMQQRLNDMYKNFFLNRSNEDDFRSMDLRPMFANYITMYEELMAPIEGPLSKLIATHGREQGYRLFYQQNGSMPDESGKRKSSSDISREDDNTKKAKIDAQPSHVTPQPATQATQSSATANKFMNFLGQSDNSTASSKPDAPVNGTTQKSTPAEPAFKLPTFDPSANFMGAFAKNAAKAAAEAKQKAKDEEFDSEDDDLEEWERQYAEKLAAKAAQVKEQAKLATGFQFKPAATSSAPSTTGFQFKPAATQSAPSTSGFQFKPAAPSSAPSSSLAPPSTNGGFNFSRSASPAASATGSVFDVARSSTPSGSNNIFGHLSNAGSDVEGSARGDADDEDSDDYDSQQSNGAKPAKSQPNGRFGGFSESDDAPSDNLAARRSLFDRIEKPSSSPSDNPFGFPKPAEQSSSAPTGGLFGRVTRDDSSERTPLATTAANEGGLFGFGTKTATAGDQTWKPDSPIRFDNSTEDSSKEPPKFSFTSSTPTKTGPSTGFSFKPLGSTTTPGSSLFGSITPGTSSLFGSKPSQSLFVPSGSSSVLPSGNTSRATTPGISDVSGAETTGGEQEETSNDPQIGDLVGMEAAKQGHDVLFENSNAKASRFDKDPTEKKPAAWSTQGVGPIAILKDQDTGVTKILMKKVPNGGIVLNTRLMSAMKYEHLAKRARFGVVSAAGKLENWIVQFPSIEEAADFVKACDENKNQ